MEKWDSNMIADSGPLLEVAITCYGAHEWLDFKMTLYQEQSSTARCKTDSASPRLSEMSSPFAETQANPFRPDPTRRASIAVYRKLTANALSLFGLGFIG
ncbi:hypothetical protein DER44DRAFT_236686 [Fusarium oxysporum]|nr:hypothetical protein DER44DRAFT_236686 [Fusarium oxysporum]